VGKGTEGDGKADSRPWEKGSLTLAGFDIPKVWRLDISLLDLPGSVRCEMPELNVQRTRIVSGRAIVLL